MRRGRLQSGEYVLKVLLVDQLNSLFSTWKTSYSQQPPAIRILIPVSLFLLVCCLCSVPWALSRRGSPATAPPGTELFPTSGTPVTPTALFDFDFPTFTPFPTLPPPSPFPSLTPLPTETHTATSLAPTATATQTVTPLPTMTFTSVPPTATPIPVVIVAVHKVAENVDIQNVGPTAIDLAGWRLVSQVGNQSCNLSGTLGPGKVLRIWADRGPGFDCGLRNEIWDDNQEDPAVLYNAEGQEVARFP